MCGGSNSDSDSGGGYTSISDMFDGGGPGKSGAQFSGAGAADLDTDGDNYISQAEYSAGKSASEANRNNKISNAYDNKDNFISGFSNTVGALPRGSIVAEAARGGNMDTMKTTGIANYLQGGGMIGKVVRGITGDAANMGRALTPQPVQDFAGGVGKAAGGMGRALTGQGNLTAAQEQERLAKSTNSIFNQGGEAPPQDVIDAYINEYRRKNPRAFRQAAAAPVPESSYYPNLIDDDPSNQMSQPPNETVLANGMYNFYENGQLVRQITEQEYNKMFDGPPRT